ncbi:MAG: DUF4350 domain-containing protein [Bryobacteraceae bacterium]
MSIHLDARNRFPAIACILLVVGAAIGWSEERRPVVVLDGYHNNEPKLPGHYRWEARDNGGFSEFAAMLRSLGAELRTSFERVTTPSLSQADCFVLVDPDTPEEAPKPNYIQDDEIQALKRWVERGGALVLMGNNRGNAEFIHLNRLAERFGIHFAEETLGADQKPAAGKLTLRATGPFFQGDLRFYAVDVAPLKVTAKKAEILLKYDETPVMALIAFGRGLVLAIGDPWLYNEYIHREDNEQIGRQVFKHLLGPKH